MTADESPVLVFATGNRGKQAEILRLLDGLALRLLFVQDVPSVKPAEETGASFEENARLKAMAFCPAVPGAFVAAEDSGLVVPALGGEPGLFSARYGALSDDASRNALLLNNMAALPDRDRGAAYEASVVLLDPEGNESIFAGRVEGRITRSPDGNAGFGYDPVFFHPALGTTFGRASQADKDRLSHRGQALRAMRAFLERRLATGVEGGLDKDRKEGAR